MFEINFELLILDLVQLIYGKKNEMIYGVSGISNYHFT